jgi:hypothetical protein
MPDATKADAEFALSQYSDLLALAHTTGVTSVKRSGRTIAAVLAVFEGTKRPANLPATLEVTRPGQPTQKVPLVVQVGPPLAPE